MELGSAFIVFVVLVFFVSPVLSFGYDSDMYLELRNTNMAQFPN